VLIFLATVFAVAAGCSLAGGAVVRRLASGSGAVVPPRPDRWHTTPTPTMGGVAIVAGTLGAFVMVAIRPDLVGPPADWLPVPLAAFAMFVVGVLDDRLQLSPLAKLVSSLAIGAFLVFALAGVGAEDALPSVYTLVAAVWFAGICHAMNLLDNMDGLAAGVGLIAAAFLAALLPGYLGPTLVVLLTALAGSLLGFLYWNRSRARLFMGDCGSLFIGAMLGAASLVPVYNAPLAFINPAVIVVLILIVPLFDTAFVLVLRRLAGLKATKGGTDHVSHRLVSLGFSERSAVRTLYLLGLVGGTTAWFLLRGQGVEPMLPLVAAFAVIVVLLGIYLARVPAYDAEDFVALQKSSFAPFLKDLAFRWHAAEVMLDFVLIAVCYYLAYRFRFEGEGFDNFLPYFTASLPVVLGCKLAALYGSGLYQRSWETFGLRDLTAVVRGVGMGSLLAVLTVAYLYRFEGFSRGVFLLDALLLGIAIVATRASFRTMSLAAAVRNKRSRRVLVYGAGQFGQTLVREMRANARWNMNPIGFIDDDPGKVRRWIMGVQVRGTLDDLETTMRRYSVDEVLLSSPSINGHVEHRIREICTRMERPVRRLRMELCDLDA
jgi:UDP-GlcNAc:undecaprenyl-phosphate/decaprenyl-phosphate GlcNAc-1-phosphate transferase